MNQNDLFVFVSNDEYKELLTRDFKELVECVNAGLNKSVLVLAGSILEAVLIEYFTSTASNNTESKRILDLKLYQLIEKAESEGLISKKAKELSGVVRDYRNYIHPAKEIRGLDSVDGESANIAYSLLKMILKEISANYYKKYEHKAEAIYNKITTDSFASSIFKDIINRMGKSEINKLLFLLLNYYKQSREYDDEEDNPFSMSRYSIYSYYNKMRPFIDDEIIKKHLNDFYKEVEQGSEKMVFTYFDFFGHELNLLGQERKQLALKYIYKVLYGIYGNLRILDYKNTRTFEHLRLYRDEKEYRNEFMEILTSIAGGLKYLDNKHKSSYLSIFITLSEGMDKGNLDDHLKKKYSY